jgi:AcrR family transcriptional regulator
MGVYAEGRHVPGESTHAMTAPLSRWTPREQELLTVTLRLLQEHGYDRLSLEDVATEARASKATLYRRWPSKAELVLAAFIEGTRLECAVPQTGSLREDLLVIGALVCEHAAVHAPTMRAVLNEVARSPALTEAFRTEFIDQRRAMIMAVLCTAAERGEIDAEAINDEVWDVLPGYLVFRTLLPVTAPTLETVRALVDDVVMPGLLRTRAH